MKRSTIIIIFFLLAVMKTQAQDYLISFAGTGVTSEVSTVKVDNLISGATLTLNGGDVLHLMPNVGINTPDIDIGSMKISPNPLLMESILTFVTPENGNSIISIADLSGRIICQTSIFLSVGTHSFRISGIGKGIYFVTVFGNNYSKTSKLISQSEKPGNAEIIYINHSDPAKGHQLKSTETTVDMKYTNGDQLLFKGVSGIYSTIMTDIPTSSKTITFSFVACTDGDGNNYATVQIGSGKSVQTWMAENLNYSTGNSWCYDNNSSNCNTYGRLYDWQTALGACPSGWHLPTNAEWTALTDILGGDSLAGGKMKETGTAYWLSPNTGATNNSGFTALPGGFRDYDYSSFGSLTYSTGFWSSTETWSDAWILGLSYDNGAVNRIYDCKPDGYSARCIKD